jgi:hypothetical protein
MIKNLITSFQIKYATTNTVNWIKLITITGTAQIIVQIVSFLSGFMLIRALPIQEYAFYTIANTMLGSMNMISDGGVSIGVLSQGGKVWNDPTKLGIVFVTGMFLRKKLALITLIFIIPILFYLLIHHGASLITSILICISLIPSFYASISDNLLEIAPKLNQSIKSLQKNQLEVNFGRLLITALTIFIFPFTFIAIIANGIARIWGNYNLKKINNKYIDISQNYNIEIGNLIIKVVKKNLPTVIFFSFSGQISLLLISIFGNTSSIAQLGALGRFGIIFSLFSIIITTLVSPSFSKLKNEKSLLFKRYTQILFITFSFLFLVIILALLLSKQFLLILGNNYVNLEFQFFLILINTSFVTISGVIFSLYTSKGWLMHPFFVIFRILIFVIISCLIFDISTLNGVLYMNIFTTSIAMLIDIIYGYYKIFQLID